MSSNAHGGDTGSYTPATCPRPSVCLTPLQRMLHEVARMQDEAPLPHRAEVQEVADPRVDERTPREREDMAVFVVTDSRIDDVGIDDSTAGELAHIDKEFDETVDDASALPCFSRLLSNVSKNVR